MSLPTAPLGQLSGLNLPYSMPTYEKRSATRDALAAMLMGAAGETGKAAIHNVTEKEFADKMGDKPNTGWARLLHGAKDNQQLYAEHVNDEHQNAMQVRSEAAASKLARQTAVDNNLRAVAGINADDARHDKSIQAGKDLASQRIQYEVGHDLSAENEARLARSQAFAHDKKMAGYKAFLSASDPNTLSEIGLREKQGAHLSTEDSLTNMTRELFTQRANDGKGVAVTTPNGQRVEVAGTPQGQAAKDIATVAEAKSTPPTRIRAAIDARLADEKKYPTTDTLIGDRGSLKDAMRGMRETYLPLPSDNPSASGSGKKPITQAQINEYLAHKKQNPNITSDAFAENSPLEKLRTLFGYRANVHTGQ